MLKLISLVAFVLLTTFSNAQNIDENLHHLELQKVTTRNNTASNRDYPLNLHYVQFKWEVSPTVNYIKGHIRYHFIAKKNLSNIVFDLASNMQVDSVKYRNVIMNTSHVDGLLDITIQPSINDGQMDSIDIYYQGSPEQTGFGAFSTGTHSGAPVLWTLSEPYGDKQWWPCQSNLIDKIDSITIEVKTPKPYKVGSNGILAKADSIDTSYIYTWKHRYPIASYLVAIAVSNYAIIDDTVALKNGIMQFLNYVYPEQLALSNTQLQETKSILRLYEKLFGEYPFYKEKYGHAQCNIGGGMEHQTMSFMGNFNKGLIAHELGHQWFGDKITCSNWKDIWLNEGFATYMAGIIYDFGINNLLWENFKLQSITNAKLAKNGAVYVDDTTSVSRIFDYKLTYVKASLLLHMLRWKMGDDLFFEACKNYMKDENLTYSFSNTELFKQHLEQTSGLNLEEFFNDWFYGEGYPSYEIQWYQDEDFSLNVNIKQSTTDASVGFFEMPIPIKFSSSSIDTTIVFNNQFNNQIFSIPLSYKVTNATADPEKWILAEYKISNKSEFNNFDKLIITQFPNPSGGPLNFNFNKNISIENIEVTNYLGQDVFKTKTDNTPNYFVQLDLTFLENGIYYVKLNEKNRSSVLKVIVMK